MGRPEARWVATPPPHEVGGHVPTRMTSQASLGAGPPRARPGASCLRGRRWALWPRLEGGRRREVPQQAGERLSTELRGAGGPRPRKEVPRPRP